MLSRVNGVKSLPYLSNYVKYKLSKKEAIINVRKYLPQIAHFLIIKKCNLACDFCSSAQALYDGRGQNWKDTKADMSKIKRILDHELFSRVLAVDLVGGEPLLVKDLPRIVSYISSSGRLTNMATNAIILKRKIQELVDSGISSINVSIYDENLSVLHRDLESINRVFPVNASFILFGTKLKEAKSEILELVRFTHNAGCKSLRLFIYRPSDFNPNMSDVIYEGNSYYADLKNSVEDQFPNFCLWPELNNQDTIREKTCAQLWQRLQVDMEGNLQVCCGSEETYANIFENDSADIYNHPLLIDMRHKLLDNNADPPSICQSCNLLSEPSY